MSFSAPGSPRGDPSLGATAGWPPNTAPVESSPRLSGILDRWLMTVDLPKHRLETIHGARGHSAGHVRITSRYPQGQTVTRPRSLCSQLLPIDEVMITGQACHSLTPRSGRTTPPPGIEDKYTDRRLMDGLYQRARRPHHGGVCLWGEPKPQVGAGRWGVRSGNTAGKCTAQR